MFPIFKKMKKTAIHVYTFACIRTHANTHTRIVQIPFSLAKEIAMLKLNDKCKNKRA